jgi:hypothetical protein
MGTVEAGKFFFRKKKRPASLQPSFYAPFLCLLCLEDKKTSRPKQSKARITGKLRLGGTQNCRSDQWLISFLFSCSNCTNLQNL